MGPTPDPQLSRLTGCSPMDACSAPLFETAWTNSTRERAVRSSRRRRLNSRWRKPGVQNQACD
jgi:hypothetical protein